MGNGNVSTSSMLRWDQDSDSVFIRLGSRIRSFHFAPMGLFTLIVMHSTRLEWFMTPSKLDGTFRFLGSDIGRLINDNYYDGTDLKYLNHMNTDKEEKGFIDDFSNRLGHQWVFDLKDIDVESDQFWIENRKYIQSDYIH